MLYSRTIFNEIIKYLDTDDILVIHGARQVGKTHILYLIQNYLKERKKESFYIDLEDSRNLDILNAGVEKLKKHLGEQGFDPDKFSKKEKLYILIDEIQYLDNPSSFLKLAADHHKNLKLIVSGSSSFAIKSKFKNSLVGRTVDFEAYPLSFEEFLIFREYPGIGAIKQKNLTEKTAGELLELFKEFTLYGGYPKIVLEKSIEQKEKYLQQIVNTYIRKDIRDLADIKEIDKFNKLVEVLASQSGNLLNIGELSNTCNLARQTVENYLFILENTYIIKLVRPYSKNIRSELFKTPKIFFYDSGLMQMLWLRQLQKEIIGNVFETSVFGEFIKKYGADNVFYWRTKNKQEIDFILNLKDVLLAVEVKLNFEKFDDTAVKYFCEKYRSDFRVVALSGELKGDNYRYPWNVE